QTPSSPTIPYLLPAPLVYFYSASVVCFYSALDKVGGEIDTEVLEKLHPRSVVNLLSAIFNLYWPAFPSAPSSPCGGHD
ncbi:MAG: hypothetical protein WBQ43_10120, partial [Terriglobales bacterium]